MVLPALQPLLMRMMRYAILHAPFPPFCIAQDVEHTQFNAARELGIQIILSVMHDLKFHLQTQREYSSQEHCPRRSSIGETY